MLKEKMSNILDEIHLANGFNRKFHNHWMVKMFFEKKKVNIQFMIIKTFINRVINNHLQ